MKKRLNDIQSMLGVDGSYRKSNKSDSETYEGRVVDAVFYNEKRRDRYNIRVVV
jgi:hypothetical protein